MAEQEQKLAEINTTIAKEHNQRIANELLKNSDTEIERISAQGNDPEDYANLIQNTS